MEWSVQYEAIEKRRGGTLFELGKGLLDVRAVKNANPIALALFSSYSLAGSLWSVRRELQEKKTVGRYWHFIFSSEGQLELLVRVTNRQKARLVLIIRRNIHAQVHAQLGNKIVLSMSQLDDEGKTKNKKKTVKILGKKSRPEKEKSMRTWHEKKLLGTFALSTSSTKMVLMAKARVDFSSLGFLVGG